GMLLLGLVSVWMPLLVAFNIVSPPPGTACEVTICPEKSSTIENGFPISTSVVAPVAISTSAEPGLGPLTTPKGLETSTCVSSIGISVFGGGSSFGGAIH